MKIAKYILLLCLSLLVLLVAYVGNWFFAPFIDRDGNLPNWLRWFQPSDNPCWGDKSWIDEHPNYSDYMLAVSYMYRNPAQGFDQYLAADVSMDMQANTKSAKWFKTGRWIFVGDYWEFSASVPFCGGYILFSHGWRLRNILEKYEHKTMGQLISWPVRWNVKGE